MSRLGKTMGGGSLASSCRRSLSVLCQITDTFDQPLGREVLQRQAGVRGLREFNAFIPLISVCAIRFLTLRSSHAQVRPDKVTVGDFPEEDLFDSDEEEI